MTAWHGTPATVRPMLASVRDAPLESAEFVYETKYDGIRALAWIEQATVRVWSRLGNEKTAQYPAIAAALMPLATHTSRPLVIDGEIVAIDAHGAPTGFQQLQRIHLHVGPAAGGSARAAFMAFDLLRDGDEDLRPLPLRERRARLERCLDGFLSETLRVSEQVAREGRAMLDRARRLHWEGLIAKRASAPYRSGARSPDWIKVKLVRHQSCVVAGWTDPRGSRPFFGALLLGVHDASGQLQYIGHTGAGFSDAELERVWRRLKALHTTTCPFGQAPKTNEHPHWVKPRLVAEVKFTEWTADGRLRHPTYLGLRDDVDPAQVRKEPQSPQVPARDGAASPANDPSADQGGRPETRHRAAHRSRATAPADPPPARTPGRAPGERVPARTVTRLLAQLDALQDDKGGGILDLPGGHRLEVRNLGKVFWPDRTLTKGDLLRHYVRVAPFILPVLADRPLVMKRFPNGIDGKPFFQHRAPARVPDGVRSADVDVEGETRAHLIGGALATLLYTAQLGAISQDPWFSRVGSENHVDHIAIDLDPPDDLPFAHVRDVARWVRDVLARFDAVGFPKTSGAGGLHVYVPMPPRTSYDTGLLFAQVVATLVAGEHPRVATIERALQARGRRIYVDYLQNSKGKTLASAYSVRASTFAGVSTPLAWEEVEAGVRPQDFTMPTFATRLAQVGDLWAGVRTPRRLKLPA